MCPSILPTPQSRYATTHHSRQGVHIPFQLNPPPRGTGFLISITMDSFCLLLNFAFQSPALSNLLHLASFTCLCYRLPITLFPGVTHLNFRPLPLRSQGTFLSLPSSRASHWVGVVCGCNCTSHQWEISGEGQGMEKVMYISVLVPPPRSSVTLPRWIIVWVSVSLSVRWEQW